MPSWSLSIVSGFAVLTLALPASAQNWVNFTNQTSTRLIADPSVGISDPEEKDYDWGDFDRDGDIDMVCVRKSPFTTIGRRRNVLFMNEGIAQGHPINGVLVDRTAQYAVAADDGGQGMLDLTDDRDVVVTDVNNDGWPDIVTATTYGAGLPKSISHPRVYINRGEIAGVWQGFKYEQARIPNLGGAPNFCGVGAGDVNGDKAPDLYFVDYDNLQASPFDDRLLINNGNGFFTDQTDARIPTSMTDSAFGTSAHIADMNGDGKLDIIKSENGPIKIIYNAGNGTFNSMQTPYSGSGYFANVGDLNGDGKLDIIISDDALDRYLLNQNTGVGGQTPFANLTMPASSSGFGSSSRFADLNNDGFIDVLVSDVDVDISGCSRQLHMFRNLGNFPTITLADQGTGGIPSTSLNGTYDVAVFDINGDGWLDLVVGRCNSTEIWINVPPSGLVFSYPQGLPGYVGSNQPFNFRVQVNGIGGTPVGGSGVLHYSVNNGPFVNAPMSVVSGNLYAATLPAAPCTNIIKFYVTAQMTGGGTFSDPSSGASAPYQAVAADGTAVTLDEHFENSTSSWTVVNDPSLTAGAWEVAIPNPTLNGGVFAAPPADNGNGDDVKCFVTMNGATGGPAAASDVDGGPTWLVSPTINFAGTDGTVSYDRWFYCEDAGTPDADFLRVEVSNNNGGSWTLVHSIGGTSSAWESASFRVGEFVTPTAQVRVRFSTQDIPNNSVTEAGIDNFTVSKLICGVQCASDIALPHNGHVDIDDLLAVINTWGPCTGCAADINHTNSVDIDDLLAVINAWGACP